MNTKTGTIKKFANQNIAGLHFLDNRYLYTLSNKGPKTDESGFYVYDVQNIIENDSDTKYFLESAICGMNKIVDFSNDNQRLCYMKDYEEV